MKRLVCGHGGDECGSDMQVCEIPGEDRKESRTEKFD
jgi:hypothetical protein